MQSKDLKVGEDYAYNPDYRRRHYRGDATRVTVEQVGVTGHDHNSRGYRRTNVPGLVKVSYATGSAKGETLLVQPATLVKTWRDHHAQRTSEGRWAAQREREVKSLRARRAQQAYALHAQLVAQGAEVGLSYCYRDEDYAALKKAGFKPAREVDFGSPAHFHSAVNDLSGLMDKGTVHLDQVAAMFGWADMPKPEDSLDDYDLDEEEVEA